MVIKYWTGNRDEFAERYWNGVAKEPKDMLEDEPLGIWLASRRIKLMKTKTEFGADREADKVLDRLPRVGLKNLVRDGMVAFLSIDDSGRLLIALNEGGLLTINEKDLKYVHGDDVWEG